MKHLTKTDPQVANAIFRETERQRDGLELIASENTVSEAVLEALGSPLTNKYSEGYPGKRYYGGNQIIDEIETLAIDRAKKLFGAEHANVQSHSGSSANFAALLALAKPGDTVLSLDLTHGGHLTHGSPANFSGQLYHMVHYGVEQKSELIDMDNVHEIAKREKPRVIIAGFSSYPRHLDFGAFRKIADEVGAYLLVDMAHFAGLVAAGLHPYPIPFADVVTTTTHKTLRGPRGAMILCRHDDRINIEGKSLAQKIDSAVFPGCQGGPLEHVIAAKAVCFKEALDPSFREYQSRVLANARIIASTLADRGSRIVSGSADNHLVLADLTSTGIGGREAEQVLEKIGISVNRNLIPFDARKPTDPSGIRLGSAAISTRGIDETATASIANVIADCLFAPNDATVLERSASVVKDLAAAHPIYLNLYKS